MKKTVLLRNKCGEFCSLGEFCKEEPRATIRQTTDYRELAAVLASNREELIKMRRLAEVIQAYDLQRAQNIVPSPMVIEISASGNYYRNQTPIDVMLDEAARIIEEQEAQLYIWHSTSYEIADTGDLAKSAAADLELRIRTAQAAGTKPKITVADILDLVNAVKNSR